MAGKADWFAYGLPRAGHEAGIPRAGDVARRDVPTCRLTERAGDVHTRLRQAGWAEGLVVNDERVVLGRVRVTALAAEPSATVEQIMEEGPTTVRPDARLTETIERMRSKHVSTMVVTTPDGQLVGLLRVEDGGSAPG